jgi:hypothetical protein
MHQFHKTDACTGSIFFSGRFLIHNFHFRKRPAFWFGHHFKILKRTVMKKNLLPFKNTEPIAPGCKDQQYKKITRLQDTPARRMAKQLLLAFILLVFMQGLTFGQTETAGVQWPLNSGPTPGLPTGNITAGNHVFGSGLTNTVYNTWGAGAYDWNSGSIDNNDYHQYSISPTSGKNLTVTQITFYHQGFGNGNAAIYYSTDLSDFNTTRSLIGTFPIYSSESIITISGLSMNANYGETLYIRVYAWGATSSTDYFYNKLFTIEGNTTTPTPTLSVDPKNLDFGEVCKNTTAGPESFTITGIYLTTDNVSVGPLNYYTFCTTADGTYTSSLSLPHGGGSYSQIIYVKFTPPIAGYYYNGMIPVGGGGATTTKYVDVTGYCKDVPPATAANPLPADGATGVNYTGSGAVSSVSWDAVSGATLYDVYFGAGSLPGSPTATDVNTYSTGSLSAGTTYYWKVVPKNECGAATGTPVEWTFTTANPPTITVSAASLDFGDICLNSSSPEQYYTISGTSLTGTIEIIPPSGFVISMDGGELFDPNYSLKITSSDGTGSISNIPIYVRFIPTAAQTYYGDISHTTTGATTKNVAVTGTGITAPSVAANPYPSNGATGICYTGTGAISSVSWDPVPGATSYDIYFGPGSLPVSPSAIVTYNTYLFWDELSASTTYYWKVVPKNGCGATTGTPAEWTFTTNDHLCYCSPSSNTEETYIHNFSATGNGTSNILNSGTGYTPGGYADYSASQSVSQYTNQQVNWSLTMATPGGVRPAGFSIWVDWNNDGFGAGDNVYITSSSQVPGTYTGSFIVPSGMNPGNYKMRALVDANNDSPNDPCNFTPYYFNGYQYLGEAEDYTMNVKAGNPPAIIVSIASLSFGEVCANSVSPEQTYTVSGTSLTGPIEITPPAGFEISAQGGLNFNPLAQINLNPDENGSTPEVSVYVRFVPDAVQSYSGNIIHASSGATVQNVAVTGTGIAAPVADFTGSQTTVTAGGSITFTDISANSPTSWSWSFPGGSPSSSTDQSPMVTYNTAGTYNVSLTATNGCGTDTETKTDYLTVTALCISPVATAPAIGDGSSGKPYQIATLENLYWISAPDEMVASPSQEARFGAHYIQVDEIDASVTVSWCEGGWNPIGYMDSDNWYLCSFRGTYNGQGHTISGLYMENTSPQEAFGLFGRLHGATIQNLAIINVDINNVYGASGALAGVTEKSKIYNCYSSGNITANEAGGLVGALSNLSEMKDCYSSCNISGKSYAGGLTGQNSNSTVTMSYFISGTVTGLEDYTHTGGLVGYNLYNASISRCYSKGLVKGYDTMGGLVGINHGASISNCYSRTNLISETNYAPTSGGLVGGNINYSMISNCYSTGYVGSEICGLVGYQTSGQISNSFWDIETSGSELNVTDVGATGKSTDEMKNASTFTGWDFTTIWGIHAGNNDGYPFLQPESSCTNGTLALASESGTDNQTICAGTAITPIVYTIGGGATDASISPDLPTGLSGVYDTSTKTFTISGTCAVADVILYTVTTSGAVSPCTNATATGTITVNAIPDAPTGSGNQSFSAGDNPTVADLTADGTNIKWYDAATDGNLLASADPLTDETLYYASQTVEGCESTVRLAVMVSLTSPNEVIFDASGTFTVPENVYWINVRLWGGGGSGGSASQKDGTGGGGGGAYSSSTLSVTPGDSYSVQVGQGGLFLQDGGDSWFSSATTVMAKGGKFGSTNSNLAGEGGSANSGYGDIKYSGGNGAVGTSTSSGGGGSSAGTYADGTSATSYLGGVAPAGGGDGGNGNTGASGDGHNGFSPGGGAGGALMAGYETGYYSGGNGASGQVIISWQAGCSTPPPTAEAQSFCKGDNPTVNDLVVTALEDAIVNWYDVASGGSPLAGSTTLTTGNYYVSQTLNDCESARKEVPVTLYETPPAPSAGSNSPICEGLVLNLTATTIENATYSWTGPNEFTASEQNPSIVDVTTAAGGTYSVTATLNGCTSAAGSVTVSVNAIPPAPLAESNSPVCEGSVLYLTATSVAGATYSWTGPDGFISSEQNPSIVDATVNAGGTYSVTATVNGCASAPAYTSVIVMAMPAAASSPNPNDGAVNMCYEGDEAITSITWAPEEDVTSWDVYFGEGNLPSEVTANVTTNSYNSGTLSANTTYYWKVVPKNDCGSSTSSTTWTFTTTDTPCCTYPTLGGASLASSNVCNGAGAQVHLTGLLPSRTFTLEYSIDGVSQTSVPGVISDASGNASFTTRNLTSDDNQKTLLITGLTDNETSCSKTFSTSLTLNVVPLPTATLDNFTTTICEGETVTLTGSVEATGKWILSITGAISGGVTVYGTGNSTFEKIVTPPVLTTTYSIMSILYNDYRCTSYTGFTGEAVVTADQRPILVVNDPEPVVAPNTVDLTAPEVTEGSSFPYGTELQYLKGEVQLTDEQAQAISESGIYTIRAIRGACDVPADVEVTVNSIAENTPPMLATIGAQSVNEQETLTFTATATDSDIPEQTLTYSIDADAFALGMNIISSTGAFSWTPDETKGGASYNVTVTVTDDGTNPAGLTHSETVTITVNEVNVAPVLDAIGARSVDEMAVLSFKATATDQDKPAQDLTFSIDAAAIALGMSMTAGGDFSWTPTEEQGGASYNVTVMVTDDGTNPADLTDFETVNITVNEVNVAPVLDAIGARSVDEMAVLSFKATATDQDKPAQDLTFSIDAAAIALGMSMTAGGDFSWIPTEEQGGASYNVTVTVTDDGTNPADLTDFETVNITVNEVNVAPVLDAIGARSVDEMAVLHSKLRLPIRINLPRILHSALTQQQLLLE